MTDMTTSHDSEVAALKLRVEAEQRQINRLERDLADVRDALAQAHRRLQAEAGRLTKAEEAQDKARAS